MRINKYLYIWVLQGKYQPYGWEDLTAENTYTEIRKRRREYRENDPGVSLRIVRRREPNPEWSK